MIFVVRVIRDGAPVHGLKLDWSAGPEMMDPVRKGTVDLTSESVRIEGGTMEQPGFLRMIATVDEDGHHYRGLATAGFAPEKIQPVTPNPEGFDAFWQEGKDALAKIPIDAERTLLPDQCTATVNVYQVSLQNVGPGAKGTSRIYGMLAEPKAPGNIRRCCGCPGRECIAGPRWSKRPSRAPSR